MYKYLLNTVNYELISLLSYRRNITTLQHKVENIIGKSDVVQVAPY